MNHIITDGVLSALRDGEHDAFEKVFLAYFGKVKFFINGLIRSEGDAEELAQEVFLKVWNNRSSIDPVRSFNSYVYTMARNAAYNFLKHKLVERSYLAELPNTEGFESSEELIFAKEIQLLVDMAVAGMPEQRKTIYNMSRNTGIDNGEIADRLNISKKTVENQLSLALREIRRVISAILAFF